MHKRTFHHFELHERLGLGGMSEVFRGVHQTLGYPVAIKILDPRLAQNQTFISRFEFEAKATSNLHSNRIVSVIDFGIEDDTYFIVMEYVDGHDLKWILDRLEADPPLPGQRGVPAEIALMLLEEVALGLKAAHDQRIVHRDIKPSNILVSRSGEVKLTDFGLGRDLGVGRFAAEDLTLPGTVMGTPAYMSPEQAAGRRDEIDHRADIFSLGVVAYHLLTGEKPFAGDDLAGILERIVKEEPAPLTRDKCPLINPDLERLVEKMLKKDPAKRFSSMDQVLTAIQGCMENLDNSLFRYRNEYLARFAQDPAAFAKELVTISIKSHLKLGYYFKNLGQSNIEDALQHFGFVSAMDPSNPTASDAIEELKRQRDETPAPLVPEGRSDSGDRLRMHPPSKVLVPHPGDDQPDPDTVRLRRGEKPGETPAPAASAGPRNRRSYLLGGGALVAVILAAFALSRMNGAPRPPAPGDSTAVAMGDSVPAGTPARAGRPGFTVGSPETLDLSAPAGAGELIVETMPAGAGVSVRRARTRDAFRSLGLTPVQRDLPAGAWEVRVEKDGFSEETRRVDVTTRGARLEIPLRRGEGFIAFQVKPEADVYLDGTQVLKGGKRAVIPAPAGIVHRLELRHSASFGTMSREVEVTAGDTLNLGEIVFRFGTISVISNQTGSISLDGNLLNRDTPCRMERIAVGQHRVGIRRRGLTIERVQVEDGGASDSRDVAPGPDQDVLVSIVEGKVAEVRFRLVAEPR